MKLISIDLPGGPRAALLIDDPGGQRVRLVVRKDGTSSRVTMREILDAWTDWQDTLNQLQEPPPGSSDLDLIDVRLLAPVPEPRTLICVGLNYRDHATETGAAIPAEPVLFAKQVTCVTGPDSAIILPDVSNEVDYEAELAVVMGSTAADVRPEDALTYVAGYTAFNDVSARDWQARTSQWMAAKSFQTFGPMGPVLLTSDGVRDPQRLRIQLLLNGETLQDSNTDQMIFSVAEIISYVSRIWALQSGDVIATGTPAGVGFTRTPPVFLRDGDVVKVHIEAIGTLCNTVRTTAGDQLADPASIGTK